MLVSVARKADDGVALIAVVITMFVGFAAVSLIAASVIFVIQANVSNKSVTQAFIAAESGRDATLAKTISVPCGLSASNNNAASPPIYSASAQTGADTSHLGSFCPSSTATNVIVINSTGTGPDGSTSTITSTYQRPVRFQNQPGGTMSYFSGQFLATQSSYKGDLVIRNGNYSCNSTTLIDGDLWVLNGTVDLSADCTITGSVYASGGVSLDNGSKAKISKDIVTNNDIKVSSNNTEVFGNLYSGGNIVANQGKVDGFAQAYGTITNTGNTIVGATTAGMRPSPAVFPVSLADVYTMTTWVDLPLTRSAWGSDVSWVTGSCSGGDAMSYLTSTLPSPYTRVGIDYTGCTGTVNVYISGGASQITHDAVFLLAPGAKMSVNVNSSLYSSLSPQPQLFFVHGDNQLGNSAPDCSPSAGYASDSLNLPAIVQARLLFYTPCGLNNSSQNGLVFNGQFYASNSDTTGTNVGNNGNHWVHPSFTCQPMAWTPLLNLGCDISSSTSTSGNALVTILPPVLISQTEQ